MVPKKVEDKAYIVLKSKRAKLLCECKPNSNQKAVRTCCLLCT